ncbi:unnamed protein product, partial [marine sediment metagenome]
MVHAVKLSYSLDFDQVCPLSLDLGSGMLEKISYATLPLMAAGLLTEGISRLENVPYLTDILTMTQVLEGLGVKVRRKNRTLEIDSTHLFYYEAPYEPVKLLRASILILGPLLARRGHARVCLPGG